MLMKYLGDENDQKRQATLQGLEGEKKKVILTVHFLLLLLLLLLLIMAVAMIVMVASVARLRAGIFVS